MYMMGFLWPGAFGQSWKTQVSEPGEKVEMRGLAKNTNGGFLVMLQEFSNSIETDDPDTSNIEIYEYSRDGMFIRRFEQLSIDSLIPRRNIVSYKSNSIKTWGNHTIVCGATEEEEVRGFCVLFSDAGISKFGLDTEFAYSLITNLYEDRFSVQATSIREATSHSVSLSRGFELLGSWQFDGFKNVIVDDFIISVDGFPLLNREAIYKKEAFNGDTLALRHEVNIGDNILIDDQNKLLFYGFGVLKTDSMLNELWRIPLDTLRILKDEPRVQQETEFCTQLVDGGYVLAGRVFDPSVPVVFTNLFFTKNPQRW